MQIAKLSRIYDTLKDEFNNHSKEKNADNDVLYNLLIPATTLTVFLFPVFDNPGGMTNLGRKSSGNNKI